MNVFELLTAFLLRPCALAAAAWLLLRVFGIRHPASRHAAWTAVLVATLLLPPLTLLTPKLTLRVLPAKIIPAATIPTADVAPLSEPVVSIETLPEPAKSQTPQRHWPTPQTLTIWLCFAGFIAMLAYRLIAWIVLRKIMSRAKRIHRFLYQSDDVLTPVTCGVLQPSIILPTDWRTWPTETRRAALAHEYAHIRRRDTLTLALTRFATSIYWFHPLTWWLAREISNQAELSCDAAVLEKSGDAKTYSRILLTFAEKVTEAQHRIALPRMAFATASGMSQRIDRIFELSGGNLRKLSHPGLLLALSGLPLTALIAAVALGSPIPHSKQPEPKLLSQSKPAPATTDTQSLTIAAPNAQPITPPQRLEALNSFTPLDSEDPHDALVVNGTLPGGLMTPPPGVTQDEYSRLAYVRANNSSLSFSMRRTYLRYGQPDQIEDHSADTQNPSQIWRYAYLNDFRSNVEFQFGKNGTQINSPPPDSTARGVPGIDATLAKLLSQAGWNQDEAAALSIVPGFPGGPSSFQIYPTGGVQMLSVPLGSLAGPVGILGQIRRLAESRATDQISGNLVDSKPASAGTYQASFVLEAGSYVCGLLIRDQATGRMYGETISFQVK